MINLRVIACLSSVKLHRIKMQKQAMYVDGGGIQAYRGKRSSPLRLACWVKNKTFIFIFFLQQTGKRWRLTLNNIKYICLTISAIYVWLPRYNINSLWILIDRLIHVPDNSDFLNVFVKAPGSRHSVLFFCREFQLRQPIVSCVETQRFLSKLWRLDPPDGNVAISRFV